MKKMICSTLLVGAAVLAFPHIHAQTPADSEQIFLSRVSEADLAETKLSQLALDKSTDPAVRAFAQKMIADHGTLDQNLKPFDDKYSVTPVVALDSEDQATFDKLNGLSGKAFDKAYVAAMDNAHHAALTIFVDEQSTGTDKELHAIVSPATQTVQMHVKMADKLAYKYNIPVPDDMPNP